MQTPKTKYKYLRKLLFDFLILIGKKIELLILRILFNSNWVLGFWHVRWSIKFCSFLFKKFMVVENSTLWKAIFYKSGLID